MKPGKCVDRIDRMKGVEREYQVAIIARDALIEVLGHDSALLTQQGLQQADLHALQAKQEATYFIRLFAEFETGLRVCRFRTDSHAGGPGNAGAPGAHSP